MNKTLMVAGLVAVLSGCAYEPRGPSLSYVDAVRPAQRLAMVAGSMWVLEDGCAVSGTQLVCPSATRDVTAEQAAGLAKALRD